MIIICPSCERRMDYSAIDGVWVCVCGEVCNDPIDEYEIDYHDDYTRPGDSKTDMSRYVKYAEDGVPF